MKSIKDIVGVNIVPIVNPYMPEIYLPLRRRIRDQLSVRISRQVMVRVWDNIRNEISQA